MTKTENISKPSTAVLDELLRDVPMGTNLDTFDDMFRGLKKALMERMLQGEMTHHLGYAKNAKAEGSNRRNGTSAKTVITDQDQIPLDIPRDREATFEPQIVAKGQTRVKGFDERVLSLYARGMSMRDMAAHLEEIYGFDVSHELISTVTDQVMEEVKAWQTRPLSNLYLIVYLDAMIVKVKDQGHIRNKALYIAIGVGCDGQREVLGLWLAQSEGAKFWLAVLTEIKNRGVQDILIACVDGLTGFPDAIAATFPQTQVQLCIVHMIRNSLNYVTWKDKRTVAADLKTVYQAVTLDEAEVAFEVFKDKWNSRYPTISASWSRHWSNLIPFLTYPAEIRRAIYTTNVIEAANRQVRKVIKTKGAFPNDDAIYKIVYLALKNAQKLWTMPAREWSLALNQFAILFHDRVTHVL